MRQGRTFKRCTKCGGRVAERKCARCGADTFTWAYVVDDAAPGQPRHQKTKAGFATKAEAVAAIAELQVAKKAGTYVEPSRLTLGAYLDSWLAGVKGSGAIRATTWKTYDVAVRVHVKPRLGSALLQQLTRNQVKALYQQLRENGRAKGPAGGLSPKAVHNVHLALRKALGDAVEDGLLRANPSDKAHKMPTDRPEMLTWSAAELRQFLEAGEAQTDPNRALWRVSANTGIRRGEALGLRWQDVDLDRARLSIRQQLVRAGETITFGPPKTKAGRRSISLDPGTVAVLRAHQKDQQRGRWNFGEAYQDHGLVFCRPDGHPHDPDVVTHQFERALIRAGVKRIRFHDLRHTHATLLLQANVHPKVVQERLGHSSIVVTLDRYSHVIPNMQDEAAAKIGAVVDGS